MKKIKVLNLGFSVLLFVVSVLLLWNTGIAADERILVIDFLGEYNYIYWILVIGSLLVLVLNLVLLISNRKHQE